VNDRDWFLVTHRARLAARDSLVFGFAFGVLVGWLYWGGR
jgi:hypothetical protein